MSTRLLWVVFLLATPAFAATVPASAPDTTSVSTSTSSTPDSHADYYSQILSLTAGAFQPQSAVISNGTYTFNYGNGQASASSSFLVEGGWAMRMLDTLPGSFYLSENIAFSRFSGSASTETVNGNPDTSLSVNLVGLDSRLNFAVERLPVKWLIPFIEGGYQVTFYSQTGSSDYDAVQGETGNFVAGAGLRIWLNRHSSIDSGLSGVYGSIPVFLTVKWNRIYPNGASLDLADQNVMGGLSVGL